MVDPAYLACLLTPFPSHLSVFSPFIAAVGESWGKLCHHLHLPFDAMTDAYPYPAVLPGPDTFVGQEPS